MQSYWEEHTGEASLVEMMLDEDAPVISDQDVEEVVRMVPNLAGKRVLELGAGIGRFTKYLAESASNVVAVDFIEKFISRNRELNADKSNVEWRCANATKLEFAPNSFDVIFSNWLLMYLTDDEVLKLLENALSWLSDSGYLFFRESCNKPSGNKKRTDNPTIYRKLSDYNNILNSAIFFAPNDQDVFGFDLLHVRSNQVYVQLKKNPFQLCWLVQKVKKSTSELRVRRQSINEIAMQELLRSSAVNNNMTAIDSATVDDDPLTVLTAKMLALEPNEEVLEIGCGLGWASFYLAKTFNVRMYAIDVSVNMIQQALERFDSKYKQLPILFELSDATRKHFTDSRFKAIYSRDTLVCISDKDRLMSNFYNWLKPGGRLCICDFCINPNQIDKNKNDGELSQYMERMRWFPSTGNTFAAQLRSAGFIDVSIADHTDQMRSILATELKKVDDVKSEFVHRFSERNYTDIINDAIAKLRCIDAGYLSWTVILAHKSHYAGRTPPPTPDNAK